MGPIKICPCWVCVLLCLYRWLWRRHTIIILMNTTTLRGHPFLRAGCNVYEERYKERVEKKKKNIIITFNLCDWYSDTQNCWNVTSWYNTYTNLIDSASNRQLFTQEKSKENSLDVELNKMKEVLEGRWIGNGWKSIIACLLIEFNVLNGVD